MRQSDGGGQSVNGGRRVTEMLRTPAAPQRKRGVGCTAHAELPSWMHPGAYLVTTIFLVKR